MKLFVSFILQNVHQTVPDTMDNIVLDIEMPIKTHDRIRSLEEQIINLMSASIGLKRHEYIYHRCRVLTFQVIDSD